MNRKFADGERVHVYSRPDNEYIGEGICGSVKSSIIIRDLDLKDYFDDEKFNEALKTLRYEVFAIKKDGTTSTRHFCSYRYIAG